MTIRINNWGTRETMFVTALPEIGLGLYESFHTFVVKDKKKFFLAVIQYGIQWEEVYKNWRR